MKRVVPSHGRKGGSQEEVRYIAQHHGQQRLEKVDHQGSKRFRHHRTSSELAHNGDAVVLLPFLWPPAHA